MTERVQMTRWMAMDQREVTEDMRAALNKLDVKVGDAFLVCKMPANLPRRGDPARARRTDPKTSHKGAAAVKERAERHADVALRFIQEQEQGATAAEVERGTGIKGIWKRCSELDADGLVEVIGERLNEETNSTAQVYRATPAGLRRLGFVVPAESAVVPPPPPPPPGTLF